MNEIDDSNLAQCCSCGFVDYWDEIPKGRCPWSEEYLTECPECGEVDNFADYTVERAKKIEKKKRFCCDGQCNQGRDCINSNVSAATVGEIGVWGQRE